MAYRYIIILFTLIYCISVSAQTKRALVIGLGKQEDTSWNKINGDNDVPYVLQMLALSGYNKRNIVTLVNEKATKQNIVMAFNQLIRQSTLNDIIYIHYSGHGQRITDVNGDERDGLDESWIPYDAYRKYGNHDKGEKHLIDDEVYEFLCTIKKKVGAKGKILVVVDACHSGGASFGLKKFGLNNDLPLFRNGIVTRGVSDTFTIPEVKKVRTVKAPEQWMTLSACKSFQVNQELNNPHVGILSYALYLTSISGKVEMRKIEDFINKNKGPYPQTPIITGETEKYNISDVLR